MSNLDEGKVYFAKIIKGIAGFYYCIILDECERKGQIFSCKAKGIFRNIGMKPLVGDNVDFEITDTKDLEGNVVKIHKRKNALIRPAVANIDKVVLVLAVESPSPAFYYLDKYLINMSNAGIRVDICWNKTDLNEAKAIEYAKVYENAGFKNIMASTKTEGGLDKLREALKGEVSVLAGASGVGKSSITNILAPKANMDTNTVSRKIERGRHTTRHSELFMIDDNTFVFDTPGFTSVESPTFDKEELRFHFHEFDKYEGKCRFAGCVHINEPECTVKKALEIGSISKIRYQSYKKMYEELSERRKY